ncbi:hypothetical protein AGMMS49991_03140 [Spirochaetia bacterium]|nr:hypothetical protein AGMMS49991_03140 [Spirochaetia bacterium]
MLLGCEGPHPACFAHLEDVLRHINLAGRPCGLFSPRSAEAIAYLSGIVRDSELAVHETPLMSSEPGESEPGAIKRWVQDIVN